MKNWICPNCEIEMKELEELAPIKLMDIQEWPTLYWCAECGTIKTFGVGENRIFSPASLTTQIKPTSTARIKAEGSARK